MQAGNVLQDSHSYLAVRRYSLKQLRAAVLAYARANFFLMHRTSLKGALALTPGHKEETAT